mmetsp:Transcript_125307/g.217206  ORF Transcript_125307/g.217206 Transcript_125307/m.217206 type:complete len:85 (+) Transcript_125307:573-827(+)
MGVPGPACDENGPEFGGSQSLFPAVSSPLPVTDAMLCSESPLFLDGVRTPRDFQAEKKPPGGVVQRLNNGGVLKMSPSIPTEFP